jgi:hypothetical protein
MATSFNARYWVKESNGNRSLQSVEIRWPEDKDRSTLYYEEKVNGRITRMISSATGWPSTSITLDELKPLN